MLRKPEFILGRSDQGVPRYLVTNAMLEKVWIRLRDRLSSLDSSTSLIEVTADYAAHFYDMYVEGHTGKHLTGDRIRILLLNLPFLFRDLIAPEVKFPSAIFHLCSISFVISYPVSYCMINIITDIIHDIIYRLNEYVGARHDRCVLSTMPSVLPSVDHLSMVWLQL